MAFYSDILGTLRASFRIGPAAARATVVSTALTAPRTIELPDKSGTVALLSDVQSGSQRTFGFFAG